MAGKPKAKLRELPLEEKLRLEAIHAGLGKPLSSDPLVGPGYAHLPRGDSKYEQQSPYAETD